VYGVTGTQSELERAALACTASMTHVDKTHAPDEDYTPLATHLIETEISDLIFVIVLMSAFNRLVIGKRQ